MKKKPESVRKKANRIFEISEAVIAIAVVAFVGKYILNIASNINEIPQSVLASPDNGIVQTEPEAEENKIAYTHIQKSKAEAFDGELILVNNNHEYRFADNTEVLVPVHEHKNDSYSLVDHSVYLRFEMVEALNKLFSDFAEQSVNYDELDEIILQSGYRSVAKQGVMYNEDLEANGLNESSRVAKPGSSEHHTGYAVDLGLYNGGLVDYDGTGDYQWITDNCYKYGLILRYKAEKSDITGFQEEPWHLRYIGLPHSYALEINNICYEEYIKLLKNFSFERPYTIMTEGGKSYQIYYVPLDGDGAEIPVPDDYEYSISGNNIDGFIVTVDGIFNENGSDDLNSSDELIESAEVTEIITGDY